MQKIMQSFPSPEQLLFTNLEGEEEQLQDIIDEGLDGGYENRIPELSFLVDSGEPYYQLLACVMLVSWGIPKGFHKLLTWASDPENVPWQASPVVFDRIFGTDSAFEMLADAVKTSFYCENSKVLQLLQIEAIKALLNIYNRFYFGRTLALAISRNKEIAKIVQFEITNAIEASLSDLRESVSKGFDLAFQTSCMLIPLAPLNDEITALYANQIISILPQSQRTLYELTNVLGNAKEEATLKVLQHLRECEVPGLEQEVQQAIKRRASK